MMTRRLGVFDFDHTVIDDNSDTSIVKLIDPSKIPKEIKVLYKCDGWTAYMQGIFNLLHKNDINEETVRDVIRNLPAVEGIPELIKEMNEKSNFDIIIISDSNSYFINLWLQTHCLKDNVLKVFTNPAQYEDGRLSIQMYHLQTTCNLSTKNLCKGQIMEEFIEQQMQSGVVYNTVVYCGDGFNDFCPILRLSEIDVACTRDKYKCAEIVKKAKEEPYIDSQGIPRSVRANVCVWNNGFEISQYLKQHNIL